MNWKREVIGILEDHYAQRQAMVAMSLELERLSLAVPSSHSQTQRLAHLVAEPLSILLRIHSLQDIPRHTKLLELSLRVPWLMLSITLLMIWKPTV